MSVCRKLFLLLWKNWIYRKHHFIITALEIAIPTLLSSLLYYLVIEGGAFFQVRYVSEPTIFEEKTFNECYSYGSHEKILYWPKNNFTEEIMMNVEKAFRNFIYSRLTIESVSSEKEMEERASFLKYSNETTELWGGIVFKNYFPPSGPPESLHIAIRKKHLDSEDFMLTEMPYGLHSSGNRYITSCFLGVQHTIATTYMKMVGAINSTDSIQITAEKFPYPPHYESQELAEILRYLLPFTITLSYVFISPTLIKRIVYEKELGIKELMKLMGLPGWIQWICWFISSFIMMLISAVIIVCFLTARTPENMAVLNKSAPELIFLVFIFYIAASIAFCLFISSVFSKPNLASVVGVLVWLLSYFLPSIFLLEDYRKLSFNKKMSLGLLPNMAFALAIRVISGFESRNIGLQWNVLDSPGYKGDNLTMSHLFLMMTIDVILYATLTWYIDNVFPGIYGIKKPWYFLFTKSYWKRTPTMADSEFNDQLQVNENFESEPVGLTPIIVIRNLSKEFTGKTRVVDDVNLNIYCNQVTALLGHNGAGKTTTMNMLTGMFSPTYGTAFINGFDIRKDIDSARESIGLCPQHNIFFEGLTVYEHLLFFGKLKGLAGTELENEISSLLNKLDLSKKKTEYPMKLSGGMKRKLNLAISLIGGPKVVILDEPTSGMDPEARRAVWDLLGEMRTDRSILLTTHSMEEADVLADRIVIMAHGKIHCCGTSGFLKKRYGAGYHLNVSKTDAFQKTEFVLLLHRHCPSSSVTSENNNEISFILPSDEMGFFPSLLDDMDSKGKELGIRGFGLSLTTMEEVFLKVGEIVDTETLALESDETSSTGLLCEQEGSLNYNTGLTLYIQQFRALLMKRIHYSRRRWILLIAQVIIPVLGVFVSMLIYNQYDSKQSLITEQHSRLMDIGDYDKSITIESHSDNAELLAQRYASVFPENAHVKRVSNTTEYIINLADADFYSYTEKHIIGANFFKNDSNIHVTALYNGIYYHSLPLSLNMIHNSFLRDPRNQNHRKMFVENHPLPSESMWFHTEFVQVQWLFGGILSSIGLALLSASFVIFPIHERVSSCKHLQLMCGTKGIFFWAASFLWDLAIIGVSALLIIITMAIMDKTGLLHGCDVLGSFFLSLLVYGSAAIPFSYVISFATNTPATGFNLLTFLSLFASIVLSITMYSLQLLRGTKAYDISQILKWIFRILPSYPISMIFLNIPQVSLHNSNCKRFEDKLDDYCGLPPEDISYEIRKCCPEVCDDSCFEPESYYSAEQPGILEELLMLMVDCFFYFFIIFLLQQKFLQKIVNRLLLYWKARKVNVEDIEMKIQMDEDVNEENTRIKSIISSGTVCEDALVVHDLTKHFWKMTAVDHLSFGVNTGECFGLLGVNGAGKTTTFRMLTHEILTSEGNAYLKYVSLKQQSSKFLSHVGYCPQTDTLIDYLTAREMLWLFARLRGIQEVQIPEEIEKTLSKFDLLEHADKITISYSGGTKRKLSAAIAFIGHSTSSVILLDEPTTGVDPVSKRKLWKIVKNANMLGTSVILTSHSMEECEALCSRVAIMVNGQFQCLGGIQHLKNKFGKTYNVKVKLPQQNQEEIQQELQDFMTNRLQECVVKDSHQGLVHYQFSVDDSEMTSLKKLFVTMEEAKSTFQLQDYSVTQATLEHVFLSFAKNQVPVA